MSAIDNAFIRAYTNERAIPRTTADGVSPQPTGDALADVVQPLPVAAPRAATSRVAATKVSLSAAKAARSAPRQAHTFGEHSAAEIEPTTNVPAPHFDLAAFTYSSSTLDPFLDTAAEAVKQPVQQNQSRPTVVPVRVDFVQPPKSRTIREAPQGAPELEEILPATAVPLKAHPLEDSTPVTGVAAAVDLLLEQDSDLLLGEPPALPEPPKQALPAEAVIAPATPAATTPATQPTPSAAKPAESSPRAGYDVEHFEWPALSEALLTKLVGGLDHLAGELVTESALGRKVVALTGLGRGEGRTTLALTLARRMAAGGVKVLLVDADFESPQLGLQLGLLIEQGWNSALADGTPLWDAMVESLGDRLTVMPLAPRPAATNGALAGRNSTPGSTSVWTPMPTTMPRWDGLRSHFDVILIDAGPLAANGAAAHGEELPASVAGSDAAVLVFDCRTGSESLLADAQRRLLDSEVIPLGVAETFCSEDT